MAQVSRVEIRTDESQVSGDFDGRGFLLRELARFVSQVRAAGGEDSTPVQCVRRNDNVIVLRAEVRA